MFGKLFYLTLLFVVVFAAMASINVGIVLISLHVWYTVVGGVLFIGSVSVVMMSAVKFLVVKLSKRNTL